MLGINKAARGFHRHYSISFVVVNYNQQLISYYGDKINRGYYMAAQR